MKLNSNPYAGYIKITILIIRMIQLLKKLFKKVLHIFP
jgi:hypothetical protein